jgi:hypothetical protein
LGLSTWKNAPILGVLRRDTGGDSGGYATATSSAVAGSKIGLSGGAIVDLYNIRSHLAYSG